MIPVYFLQAPRVEMYVFATLSGTASVVMDLVDNQGRTLYTATVSVTSTPATLFTLLGTHWNKEMVGYRLMSVATADIYYNTSGSLANGVAAVGEAPTSASSKIAIGDYSTSPYKGGLIL